MATSFCPEGTYSAFDATAVGLSAATSCKPCLAGFFCGKASCRAAAASAAAAAAASAAGPRINPILPYSLQQLPPGPDRHI